MTTYPGRPDTYPRVAEEFLPDPCPLVAFCAGHSPYDKSPGPSYSLQSENDNVYSPQCYFVFQCGDGCCGDKCRIVSHSIFLSVLTG